MNEPEDTNDPTDGRDAVEVIEIVTGEIDSEGNTITDDTVFVVDDDGTVISKDETITFASPDGRTITSRLGDDGEMHIVDDGEAS